MTAVAQGDDSQTSEKQVNRQLKGLILAIYYSVTMRGDRAPARAIVPSVSCSTL